MERAQCSQLIADRQADSAERLRRCRGAAVSEEDLIEREHGPKERIRGKKSWPIYRPV